MTGGDASVGSSVLLLIFPNSTLLLVHFRDGMLVDGRGFDLNVVRFVRGWWRTLAGGGLGLKGGRNCEVGSGNGGGF